MTKIIVLGAEAIEGIEKKLDNILIKMELIKSIPDDDHWLSPLEAAKYTGFSKQWINAKAAEIGAFKKGTAIRFKKSNIDIYMDKHSFKK